MSVRKLIVLAFLAALAGCASREPPHVPPPPEQAIPPLLHAMAPEAKDWQVLARADGTGRNGPEYVVIYRFNGTRYAMLSRDFIGGSNAEVAPDPHTRMAINWMPTAGAGFLGGVTLDPLIVKVEFSFPGGYSASAPVQNGAFVVEIPVPRDVQAHGPAPVPAPFKALDSKGNVVVSGTAPGPGEIQ